MKRKLLFCAFLFFICANSFAQVAINADSSRPHPSSMLDVKSTTRGVLIPRMTDAQMKQIYQPAAGLLVYNTSNFAFWYYSLPDSTKPATGKWEKIPNADDNTYGFELPYSAAGYYDQSNATAFAISNTNVHGNTAEFIMTNPESDGYALKATSLGKKSAGYFIGNSYANSLTTGIGNVGIGIDSAAAHVHIFGGSLQTYPQLMLETSLADSNQVLFKNHGLPGFWAIKSYNSSYNSLEKFNFYNSTYGNILSLTGDGNVGIAMGDAAPKARMQINATSAVNKPQLLLYNNGDDYARLSFQNTNSSDYWTIAGYNEVQGIDQMNFFSSKSNVGNILSLTSDGKVGVNNAAPSAALDVVGNTLLEGPVNFIGSLSVGANPGGAGQVLTSNGAGVQPQWKSVLGYNSITLKKLTNPATIPNQPGGGSVTIHDYDYTTPNLTGHAYLTITGNVVLQSVGQTYKFDVRIVVDGVEYSLGLTEVNGTSFVNVPIVHTLDLTAGVHNISFNCYTFSGGAVTMTSTLTAPYYDSRISYQLVTQ